MLLLSLIYLAFAHQRNADPFPATGSTAYALAAGGPVIAPGVSVLQLIPICPHSLASRALVFSDTEAVEIFPANRQQLILVVDGNAGCYMLPDDRVQKSPFSARFIRLVHGGGYLSTTE